MTSQKRASLLPCVLCGNWGLTTAGEVSLELASFP